MRASTDSTPSVLQPDGAAVPGRLGPPYVLFDDFIRTTEERHRAGVSRMVQKIADRGDLYDAFYEGPYCVSCEAFKPEKDLVDGLCPVHGTTPDWIREKNHFFRLSATTRRP